MNEPKPLYRCDLCKSVDYQDDVIGCKRCGFDEMKPIAQPQPEPTSKGVEDELRESVDSLRRALEIIAVGDSQDPVRDAGDELVALGYWSAEAVAQYRAAHASQQRETQEAAEQHREERLELAKAMLKRYGHAARNIGFDAASRKEHEDAAENIVRAIVDGIDFGGKQ